MEGEILGFGQGTQKGRLALAGQDDWDEKPEERRLGLVWQDEWSSDEKPGGRKREDGAVQTAVILVYYLQF